VPCCHSFLLNPSGDFQLQGWFHDLKYPWLRWQMWKRWNVVER
jgi:hypothetical protein